MPTKDDPRITVRLPQALYDSVVAHATNRGQSVGAYMRALAEMAEHGVVSTEPIPPQDLKRAARYVRERGWVQTYRCPRDCKPDWRPSSPTIRCPACNSKTVAA